MLRLAKWPQHMEANRAIRQVHTQAAGSDWHAGMPHCMATRRLSYNVRCPCKCSPSHHLKNIYKGAWHLGGTYESKTFSRRPYLKICTYQNFPLYGKLSSSPLIEATRINRPACLWGVGTKWGFWWRYSFTAVTWCKLHRVRIIQFCVRNNSCALCPEPEH